MRRLSKKISVLFILQLFIILGLGQSVYAQSAINCHCFKERDYNPADRFAADDYILATSFNSLLAKHFAISKGQIIMLKMNEGVPQDDLLIGLKVSQATGENVNRLLGLRQNGKSWQEVITGISDQDKVRNDPLLLKIISGMKDDLIGSSIADEIISRFYKVPAEEIEKLRKTGLNEKEITLLYILVYSRSQKTADLLKQHGEKNKSWSEIAHNSGVEPAEAGKLILAYPAKQIND
jgi:hypothetical protein